MILELKNLEVDYLGARVLKSLNLKMEDRSVVCLIGGNGAGKTTVLRTISALKSPAAGSIAFKGQEISGLAPDRILSLGVGHVPQEGRIFTDMTVAENLTMGAYLRRDKDGISRDLGEVYGYFPILRERRQVRAGNLSGGERQMLAIGRALMGRPELLLMDEPTAGLAPMVVEMIGRIITRLNENGISILLVEQNAELALKISDYGYVLEMGRISFEGPAGELKNDSRVKEAYLGI